MITSLQLQDLKNFADLHNAKQLRQSQGLGPLLASGWMEDALARRIEVHL